MNEEASCVCAYCYSWGVVSELRDLPANDDWAVCLLCFSSHAHDIQLTS